MPSSVRSSLTALQPASEFSGPWQATRTTKLCGQRSCRTSACAGLERDSRNMELHSNANGGGRVDTAAWQGQGRQGLGEEGLWQVAQDASSRKVRQDLLRMRQPDTTRATTKTDRGRRMESWIARHLVRERPKAKAVARATAQ